jgi:hypothetical protein
VAWQRWPLPSLHPAGTAGPRQLGAAGQARRTVANNLNAYASDRPHLVDALDTFAVVLDPWVFRIAVLAVAAWLWHRRAGASRSGP